MHFSYLFCSDKTKMLDLGYHFSNEEYKTNNVYCVGNIAKGRNLFKCFWRVQHH